MVHLLSFLALCGLAAEDGGSPLLPCLSLPDGTMADLAVQPGHLLVLASGEKGRLIIIRVRPLGSEDIGADGAIRDGNGGVSFLAAHGLMSPTEAGAPEASARVVGGIRCESAGHIEFPGPVTQIRASGTKAYVVGAAARSAAGTVAAAPSVPSCTLFEIDVSDRTRPRLESSIEVGIADVRGIATDGQRLALSGDNKVLVFSCGKMEKADAEIGDVKRPSGLALAGTDLFVGCAEGLVVCRIKGDGAQVVGRHRGPAVERVLVERGQGFTRACLVPAAPGTGVTILDMGNLAEPVLLGRLGEGELAAALPGPLPSLVSFEMTGKGYSARLVCIADPRGGLKAFDVTRPAKPRLVGQHPGGTEGGVASAVGTDGIHVYIGSGRRIEVVRLSAALHIDLPHEFPADMEKSGDFLYVVESEATKQLYIYHVADRFSGTSPAPFSVPLCVGTYRLETPDDTDLEAPGERLTGMMACSRVGSLVLGAPLRRIRVIGDRAWIMSSPAYLMARGEPDPSDRDETQPPRLFEIDVSVKRSPRLARGAVLPVKSAADLAAHASHVAVCGDGRVLIYEVGSLEKPTAVLDVPGALGLFIHGGRLFVGADAGLEILELGREGPKRLGRYETRRVGAVFVDGRRAYLCHPEKGGTVEIVDLENPAEPRKLGEIGRNPESVYHGLECPVDVEARGDLVCVADYCFGLKVFDVSRVTEPRYLGGHYRFSVWWKVSNFRVCSDESRAYAGLRAAMEIVNLPTGRE